MTSLGEYCTAGTIRCNKIIATTADLPSGGGGGGGDIDVDSINFDNKWKIYLDANSDFIIKNEVQNVISLSGDAHTGKVTLHDFNLDDLANVDTSIKDFGSFMYYESIQQKYEFTNKVRFLGTSLDVSSIPIVTSAGDLRLFNDDTSANIFLGGYTRHNPTLNGASIGIGYQACDASNRSFNVGIGYQAGKIEQGIGFPFQGQSVAIGYQAGESFQKVHAISLGAYAGRINQGESSLACGFFCGNNAQGNYAVGLGNACAQSLQGDFAVAIGASSGNIHQGIESLACGSFSGHTNLGYQSVALGHRASYDGGDFSNTIVINATGSDLDPEGTDRTYIKPIREQLNNEFLLYNNISGEVTRSAEVNFTSNIYINGVSGALDEVITGDGTGGVFWSNIYNLIYPVGSVKIMFGTFGGFTGQTWVEFGQGRTLVGLDAGDADFDTIGEQAGFKEIALTQAQMPRHTHIQNAHSHQVREPNWPGGQNCRRVAPCDVQYSTAQPIFNALQSQDTTATNQHTGGVGVAQSDSNGQAHNNLQPYIVVRYYRRTA